MLNFLHLKYFHDAFTYGSFSEAAKRNFVSRPAISQAIKTLEIELGEALVYHQPKKAELTPKGKWLLVKTGELLAQAKSIEQQVKCVIPEDSEPVIICCSHSLAECFLGAHGQRESPLANLRFPVEIRLGDAFVVRRALEANEAHFGIAVDDGNFTAFETECIYKGKFVLSEATPCKHKRHLLLGDKGQEVELLLERIVKKVPWRVTRVQSWNIMAALAAQGVGRAWHPDFLLQRHKNLQVVESVKKVPFMACNIVVVSKNKNKLSENAKSFLEKLSILGDFPNLRFPVELPY